MHSESGLQYEVEDETEGRTSLREFGRDQECRDCEYHLSAFGFERHRLGGGGPSEAYDSRVGQVDGQEGG